MLIAHLSDPHLQPRGALYKGLVDSNAMFEVAIRHLQGLDPQPDLVLLTGDIVEAGTDAEYDTAVDLLSRIRQPVLAIPGNHDDRETFRRRLGHLPGLAPSGPLHLDASGLGLVRIIGVDVTVPGAHHGDMDDAACAWLTDRLAEESDRPTIIMLHQPPFKAGIPYIDRYNCRGGDRLAAIVSRFPAVERILCGHIHRHMQLRFGGTIAVTAPSTTTAIALRLRDDPEPASFVEPRAMLLHYWRPSVGLITHLVPIGSFRGPMPFY